MNLPSETGRQKKKSTVAFMSMTGVRGCVCVENSSLIARRKEPPKTVSEHEKISQNGPENGPKSGATWFQERSERVKIGIMQGMRSEEGQHPTGSPPGTEKVANLEPNGRPKPSQNRAKNSTEVNDLLEPCSKPILKPEKLRKWSRK